MGRSRSRSRSRDEMQQRQRRGEMFVFVVVSALGIFALGNGLNGLFGPGSGSNLAWLAVAGVAILILFRQMGRVHDAWPHRGDAEEHGTGRREPAAADAPRLVPAAKKETTL